MKGTKLLRRIAAMVLAVMMMLSCFTGCAGAAGRNKTTQDSGQETTAEKETERASGKDTKNTERTDDSDEDEEEILEDETYSSKDDVAEYLYLYGHLPDNYITKSEAKKLGWVSSKGNLWDVAPGMSIGGDTFGNREGLLPKEKGRKYYECDVDYEGGYRSSERIIYSNDGLVYYTEDHYNSFDLLYGEED